MPPNAAARFLVNVAIASALLLLLTVAAFVLGDPAVALYSTRFPSNAYLELSPSFQTVQSSVPPILHRVSFETDGISWPDQWTTYAEDCRAVNPDLIERHWNRSTAYAFVEQHYPRLLYLYESYVYDIQRMDAFRYLVLHEQGGIYLDNDVACKQSLEPLRHLNAFLLPQDPRMGANNYLLISPPRHPFLKQVIDGLPAAMERNRHYLTPMWVVLLSTGPWYLGAQLARYAGLGKDAFVIPAHYLVADLDDALLVHKSDGSWHRLVDISSYVMHSRLWQTIILVFTVIVSGALLVGYRYHRSQRIALPSV